MTKHWHSLYFEYMSKYKLFVIVFSLVAVLSVVSACGQKSEPAPTPTGPITPGPQSIPLINGDIAVEASTNYELSFIIDTAMKDVKVVGKFRTFGGAPNAIQVYIMDDASWVTWLKGTSLPLTYDSGRLSFGLVDEAITTPGKYHLVFTNWSGPEVSAAQQVSVNFDLTWVY